MAEIRRDPSVEGRAALGHAARALCYAALGVAIVLAVSRWWPDDLEPSHERTARTVVWIALAVIAVGTLWFIGAALARGMRWRRARRWDRMLRDPGTAALVPPTEAHVDSVPEAPGGITVMVRFVGLSLLVLALATYGVLAMLQIAPLPEYENGEQPAPGSLIFLAVLVLAATVGAGRALRKWRVGRAVARLAADLDLPEPRAHLHGADISPRRAAAIPSLDVMSIESGSTRASVRRITADANSFGDPPPCILYLRLFDNEQGTQRFLAGPWREYGYIHLLRSATSVSRAELDAAERARSGDALFITSEAELDAELAAAATAPERRPDEPDVSSRVLGWMGRRRGVADMSDEGPYPVYPARQLMCHDGFWKRAIDLLLARMDLVVLDLSGYHREHAGTGYELQRVVDRFPIECVLMVAARGSDQLFLEAQVGAAWSQMADGSPNAGTTRRSVLIDRSDWGADRSVLARVRQRRLQASPSGGT